MKMRVVLLFALTFERDASERPTATLLRCWADGCAFCDESLPAIDAPRRE
jgi:hypothetical protein